MPSRLSFPEGFLWGTATSSHQVEGHNQNNDWWAWEQAGKIREGHVSGVAAEWWTGRAEEDLSTAAELGQNAHRLSVEWSRLEPAPGEWNEAAFARYARLFAHAKSLGMTLMVTVNHFTLPRWATGGGGWLDPALPDRLGAFAHHCVQRLGEWVDLWATINEPNVLAFLGYGLDRWPPGSRRLRGYGLALANLLRAHVRVYETIRGLDAHARIGLVLNLPRFEPARAHAVDHVLARAHDWTIAGSVIEALRSGRVPRPLALRKGVIPGLARSFDWLGLNYYGRYAVRFDVHAPDRGFSRYVQAPGAPSPATDWGQPFAPGITQQLVRLQGFGVPLYVTENGIYDNEDAWRARFILEHVRAVHDAIAAGVDVRGYFHWSLVDNFEWAEGWTTRFGLLALDRKTGARRRRASADVYAEICRANAVSP